MTQLVDPDQIERIVGVNRHDTLHYARAVSAEQVVYILHSHQCRTSGIDLRDCGYSRALGRGIDPATWDGIEDRPVKVAIRDGLLEPAQEQPS